eukprot:m.289379 g.289379  ORF g.289379 m.289379 type:complete len:110 (-) comp27107_c1_seq8:21-350(-)
MVGEITAVAGSIGGELVLCAAPGVAVAVSVVVVVVRSIAEGAAAVAVVVAVVVAVEQLGARTTPVNDPSETRRFFFFGRELLKSVCGSPSDIVWGARRSKVVAGRRASV